MSCTLSHTNIVGNLPSSTSGLVKYVTKNQPVVSYKRPFGSRRLNQPVTSAKEKVLGFESNTMILLVTTLGSVLMLADVITKRAIHTAISEF